jgi:hypothetical protein
MWMERLQVAKLTDILMPLCFKNAEIFSADIDQDIRMNGLVWF